jgi:hypothetical protein
MLKKIASQLRSILAQALGICAKLFKIMIPIIVGVKILQELNAIQYVAVPLEPIMQTVGLPASMGLVWATAMVNTLYAAMVVFFSLSADMSLTVAQVTVLCTMMLVAHALPLEGKIAQKSGVRFGFQVGFRILCAWIFGWLLHKFYSFSGYLDQPNVIFWKPEQTGDLGYLQWALDQAGNLVLIFGLICGLISIMRILQALRITDLLIWLLKPLLRLLGIGKEAGTITIVGMTMGLAYGGGLIIQEAESGRVAPKDVFASISLMGLVHSLIEDTLLMSMLGAHISGVLWGRLFLALLAIFVLMRFLPRFSANNIHRFFFKNPAVSSTS